jgi:hypothetical protein
MVLKEIKALNKWRNIYEQKDSIKMSISPSPELKYRFNTIPIKIPS